MKCSACLILALSLASCGDELPPERAPAPDHELDLGSLRINVSGLATVTQSAKLKLIVDRTSPPAATNVVVVERPLDGALILLETVFVPEGIYKVTLELRDASGYVFLKGSTSGVGVLQGQTTSVTVEMVPSGAVQVVAELAHNADVFELAASTDDGSATAPPIRQFSATQRVISEASGAADLEYVALAEIDGVWKWWSDETPLGLLISSANFEPVTGLPNPGYHRCTLSSAGGSLFAVCQQSANYVIIYRGDDQFTFRRWSQVDFISQLRSGSFIEAVDSVRQCLLVLDSQLNVFCALHRKPSAGASLGDLWLVRSFSATGAAWSPLPPYLGENDAIVSGKSLPPSPDNAPLVDPLSLPGTSQYGTTPHVVIINDFGIYRLWAITNATPSGWIHYATSTDRRTWPRLLGQEVTKPDGELISTGGSIRGLAVFKTNNPATWQMIVVDKLGARTLYTSPVN